MNRYPEEVLDRFNEDDGTMSDNVATLADHVVGHRIVSAEMESVPHAWRGRDVEALVLTLDNGKQVALRSTDDCCAYTDLHSFLLRPEAIDHVIMGVGTTDQYQTWHIYADWGDVLKLEVGWSCGNPFYYGYGFDINVVEVSP